MLAVLLVASGFVAAACSSKPAGPPPIEKNAKLSIESYFPLTAKSRWTYRVQELRKGFDYVNRVRVFGRKHFEPLDREVIEVEESYSSNASGVFLLEEQEPVIYFLDGGYLNRMFLTHQAGKLIATSGSGDSRFLPEVIVPGSGWESDSQALRVGGELGFKVANRHAIVIEEDTITVPAGTFENCIRIDTFSTQGPGSGSGDEELAFYYSDWYAPEVGLIRTQQWDDVDHERERTRIELLDYDVQREKAANDETADGKPGGEAAESPSDS